MAAAAEPSAAQVAHVSEPGEQPAQPEKPLLDVPILAVTASRQRQHGLRHNDYLRYRQYCARMIRSARVTTGLTHLPRKPTVPRRQLTPDSLASARQLDVPLGLVERAWASAMDDKQHVKEEPRRHFHAVTRLTKASKYVNQLYELIVASKRCTPRTEAEAKAYKCWIEGSEAFERKQWERCVKAFTEAKAIYTALLADMKGDDQRTTYVERCEEISGSLSFCAYNLRGSEEGQEALLQIKTAAHSARLQDQLESALEEERVKEASAIKEITWLGRTVPVASRGVRVALSQSRGIEQEIATAQFEDFDALMGTYDRLFIQHGEALEALANEMEREKKAAGAHISEAAQERLAHMQFLRAYILHDRLLKMVDRNMRMVRRTLEAYEKSDARPEDLVRLYDILLQNQSDMEQIEILQDDPDFMDSTEAHTLYYKAMRCFFVAEFHRLVGKPAQALALYQRCVDQATKAKTKLQKLKTDNSAKAYIADLQNIMTSVRTQKCSMQAKAYLHSKAQSEKVAAPPAAAGKTDPVLEHPLEYNADAAVLSAGLLHFPPAFQAVACKPLFFDLAGNHVSYPSIKKAAAASSAAKPAAKAATPQKPAPPSAPAQPAEPPTTPGAAAGSVTETVTGMFKSLGGWWGSGDKTRK